jgi:chemotaxis protein CheD
MSQGKTIPVQIGQVKIGREGQSLNAILGSCVGLGFLLPETGVFGLAHCLLAKSNGSCTKGDGRHVDQAIVSLLSKMEVADDMQRKLRVFLAGGANMTLPSGTDPSRLVGLVNATYARKALREARLRVIHEDTGGDHGRRVTIDCTSGDFSIEAIPRLGVS